MAGLGQDEVRVVVRGAGKNGQPTYYKRKFAGITVAEAVRRLDSNDPKQGGLPRYITTISPYTVNGEEVEEYSDRVLKGGDIFAMDDP